MKAHRMPLRMPFGLRNAPATFQRFINNILCVIENVFIYMDDILNFTKLLEEHYIVLCKIFECLNEYGLTINLKKSKFCVSNVDFLGFHVSKEG